VFESLSLPNDLRKELTGFWVIADVY